MKHNILADFHVHSDFSDGVHSIAELVDLYGAQGFGAIAITDHICESETFLGRAAYHLDKTLSPKTFKNYVTTIEAEAERAWHLYKMIVLPGFELSKNSWNNHRSAHILAIGAKEFIPADGSITELTTKIRSQNALAVAAHPVWTRRLEFQTYHLWDNRENLEHAFDAWEVASGRHFFNEVKNSKLPMLATGDVHARHQLSSWKTTLRCERNPEAVLDSVRKQNVDFIFYQEN